MNFAPRLERMELQHRRRSSTYSQYRVLSFFVSHFMKQLLLDTRLLICDRGLFYGEFVCIQSSKKKGKMDLLMQVAAGTSQQRRTDSLVKWHLGMCAVMTCNKDTSKKLGNGGLCRVLRMNLKEGVEAAASGNGVEWYWLEDVTLCLKLSGGVGDEHLTIVVTGSGGCGKSQVMHAIKEFCWSICQQTGVVFHQAASQPTAGIMMAPYQQSGYRGMLSRFRFNIHTKEDVEGINARLVKDGNGVFFSGEEVSCIAKEEEKLFGDMREAVETAAYARKLYMTYDNSFGAQSFYLSVIPDDVGCVKDESGASLCPGGETSYVAEVSEGK